MSEHGRWTLPVVVLLAVALATLVAVGTWHTLVADFLVSGGIAAVLAVSQTAAVVGAWRWPTSSWTVSLVTLLAAGIAVPDGAGDGLWPDPSLYVHLAAVFVCALRGRRWLAALMPLCLVAASLVRLSFSTADELIGSPGVAETTGLAIVTVVVAVTIAAVLEQRDDALRTVAEQRHTADAMRRRAERLHEHGRIARELHDTVAHHLTVIAVNAEAAAHLDAPDERSRRLDAVRRGAVDGLAEVRRVVGVLRTDDTASDPPTLTDLDALVQQMRASGMDTSISTSGMVRPLDRDASAATFRVVQEALSNALRHAPGASTSIRIDYGTDQLTLCVTNDPPDSQRRTSGPVEEKLHTIESHGYGLTGMRERIELVGGDLDARPTPNGGFAVIAKLPAPQAST